MADTRDLQSTIPGWGADLDPADRPAYPKKKVPVEGTGAHWDQPEQQVPHVKIYHSIERPTITPVFGTTAPPSMVSGKIRDIAYKYSEAQLAHWMLLLFADRVNVVEGIVSDLARGHVPNIWSEMGLSSELKYNKSNFQKKALMIGAGLAGFGGALFWSSQRKKKQVVS